MKHSLAAFIVLWLLAPILAQAEPMLYQSYTIGDVRFIEANKAVSVELRQADQPSLRAEATEGALERATVDVRGERLILSVKRERRGLLSLFRGGSEPVLFRVELPNPAGVKLSGASGANIEGVNVDSFDIELSGASRTDLAALTAESLTLRLSGASNVTVNQLNANEVRAQASGASNVAVKTETQVDVLDVNLSGASRLRGALLEANEAKVVVSGASNVELTVLGHLDIHASGASSVRYSGSPQVRQNVSGASSVRAQ
jgi:hypothetical protein